MNATPRLLGGRYEVGDLIGRGGMAEVHVGRDTRLGRTVAIKMLRSDLARDPSFQARFRREAQSAAALNHPSIVAVYDSGEEHATESGGGTVSVPYIVMEYVEGRTLRDALRSESPMEWHEAMRVASGVLAALEYSHTAGIVHRDIKPANVMLTPSGDVKVMDFGIARALADTSATMTQTQAVIGTAQYLSPEQARGETVDARSDLYSAGCLLYELVSGRPPFVADSPVAIAYQHVGEHPQAPSVHTPTVPETVDAVILHALVKDREQRYQSAREFRADVDAVRNGGRISAAAAGTAGLAAGAAAGAAAGEATQVVPALGGATQAVPAVGAGSTQTIPAVGAEEITPLPSRRDAQEQPKRSRAAVYALLGLAVIAVLVLLGAFGGKLFGGQTPASTTVSVPSVVGKTQAEAAKLLQEKGLTAKVEQQASTDVAKGSVIDVNPSEGTQVKRGSAVTLTVSTGPSAVTVPDLTGKSRDEAKQDLEAQGLKLGRVSTKDTAEQPEGKVVSSSPGAGESAAEGSAVDIVLASGKVEVPDVRGKSVGDATITLTNLGLKVDTKYQDSPKPDGQVIDESDVGKKLSQGDTVTLTVSRQQQSTPTQTDSSTPTDTGPLPTPTDSGTQTGPTLPGAGG